MAHDPQRPSGEDHETPKRAAKIGVLWIAAGIVVAVIVAFFAFSGFEAEDAESNSVEEQPAASTADG